MATAARKRKGAGDLVEEATITSENGKPTGAKADTAEAKQRRHEQRKAWFLHEASRQASNRLMMARCEAYYDGEQWDYADAQEVRDRGQNPVVYNEVKPTIDWLMGTERRTRVDFFVVSEDEGEQADEEAQAKTKLLKYLDDVNRAQFERSYAAEDAFKAGMGWLEVGIRMDKTGAMIYVGAESWRNVLWDSQAQKRDLSDARYFFRIKVLDLDVAIAMFPDQKEKIERCRQTGDTMQVFSDWLGGTGLIAGLDQFAGIEDELDRITAKPVDLFNARERVLLLECWSREPIPAKITDEGMADPVTFRMRVSIMTEHDTLIEAWSPFRHDESPFIPVWGYRSRRTGLPYSPIRPLMGPQEALNHRMSKSLYEASVNQMEMEKGAIDKTVMDLEEVREELNAPDGIAIYADGALTGNRVRQRDNKGNAKMHLELAQHDIAHIRGTSGVSTENLNGQSNLVSGKALLAKADQGSLLTAELFDNQLLARQMEGERTLSLAEQFVVQPMTVRVAGEGGQVERLRINEPLPDGRYKNDITARRAHFVIGEQAWKQSYAEASFESLMQVMTQLAGPAPNVVVAMLDVLFEMHPNLPRKQALLQRIRSVNGQTDPNGKMTPEQKAEAMKRQQIAQAQFEAQMAQLRADVKEAEAKGEKLSAEAMATRLEALYMSAQGAQVLLQAPGAMPIADQLLASAGYIDQSGTPNPLAMPGGQTMPQQPQQPVPMPELQQADGAMTGIETPAADGALQPQGA